MQVLLEELQAAVQASPFGSITLTACCPGSRCDYLIIKVCFLARNAPCTAFLTIRKCSQDLSSSKLTQALLHATGNLLRIPADRLAVWQVGSHSLTGFYSNTCQTYQGKLVRVSLGINKKPAPQHDSAQETLSATSRLSVYLLCSAVPLVRLGKIKDGNSMFMYNQQTTGWI